MRGVCGVVGLIGVAVEIAVAGTACCCGWGSVFSPCPSGASHSSDYDSPRSQRPSHAADEHGDLRSLFSSVVGLSQPATPAGPLSVEAVRTKLALLPADRSVADEAPAWLADWHPDMVVQLLLLLDSPTTAARAVQLFEWLRALPPEAPLAHLCTPSTYTAMIELYGRWRKPKAVRRGGWSGTGVGPCVCRKGGGGRGRRDAGAAVLRCKETAPPSSWHRPRARLPCLHTTAAAPLPSGGALVKGAQGSGPGQRGGSLRSGGGLLQVG